MKKLSLAAIAMLALAGTVNAKELSIPQESGWSGFLMGGVGAVSYKSNFFKGPKGDRFITSVDQSPRRQNTAIPILNADIRYTFADSRTQIFLGNLIEDAVRFDFTQQLGVRQEVGQLGVMSGGVVFSGTSVKTWSDPYAANVKRADTGAQVSGFRLGWTGILGSKVNATLTHRIIELDAERSGESLLGTTINGQPFTQEHVSELSRNGEVDRYQVSYIWQITPQHSLVPALNYKRADLDGKAESHQSSRAQLTYSYGQQGWSVISTVYAGRSSYDKENPIYGARADAAERGINVSFFKHHLFGVQKLSGFVSAAYDESDSDIGFHDSLVIAARSGVLYNF